MAQNCMICTSNDQKYVNLFATLLSYHHLSCHILELDSLKRVPENGDYQTYFVLLSQDSLTSINLKNAVEALEQTSPESQFIILLLDSIHPDEFPFHLRNYQAVNFSSCMLEGFDKLMSIFDRTFLPRYDRRTVLDRREYTEQRTGLDRRTSTISQRLRTGLWKSYSFATGAGVYDYLMMEAVQQVLVIEFLKTEAENYIFTDEHGNVHEPVAVLEKCSQAVWDEFGKGNFERAISVIEAIADKILNSYKVSMRDRRQGNDRRTGSDRRKANVHYSFTAA